MFDPVIKKDLVLFRCTGEIERGSGHRSDFAAVRVPLDVLSSLPAICSPESIGRIREVSAYAAAKTAENVLFVELLKTLTIISVELHTFRHTSEPCWTFF
jgi:hypothetical protein